MPADATATVVLDTPSTITVINEIVRVTAPVHLVKTYSGPQDVIDPDRTYPIQWSCTYGTVVVASRQACRSQPTRAASRSRPTCRSRRFAPPSRVISVHPRTIRRTGGRRRSSHPRPSRRQGTNTITVANTLVRDTGRVIVREDRHRGDRGIHRDGTESSRCTARAASPGHPEIQPRTRDGSIANVGEVIVEPVSIGWSCVGVEETPGQELLRDSSYAWAPAILDPPFTLTLAAPELTFRVENPIVRVTDTFTIIKEVVDPNGVVLPTATFTGTYSCQYGTDPPVTGTWTITPFREQLVHRARAAVPRFGLHRHGGPRRARRDCPTPRTRGARRRLSRRQRSSRGHASVTVTNTVGAAVGRSADHEVGRRPGRRRRRRCRSSKGSGRAFRGRTSTPIGSRSASTPPTIAFTPEDELVPATASCSIIEDTQDANGLRDGSFAWGEPTYEPDDVTLVAGDDRDARRHQHRRARATRTSPSRRW